MDWIDSATVVGVIVVRIMLWVVGLAAFRYVVKGIWEWWKRGEG